MRSGMGISTHISLGKQRELLDKEDVVNLEEMQKQSSRGVRRKMFSENMQQIYKGTPMSKDPLFKWRKLNNTTFPKHLNIVYGKTFYWKKSIFLSPSEKAWNDYIEELTSHSTQ